MESRFRWFIIVMVIQGRSRVHILERKLTTVLVPVPVPERQIHPGRTVFIRVYIKHAVVPSSGYLLAYQFRYRGQNPFSDSGNDIKSHHRQPFVPKWTV